MKPDLLELASRLEPIIPELKMFEYAGPMGIGIHHPLLIDLFYDPERAAWINERYRLKRRVVQEASDRGDWSTYVFTHERPYRLGALHHAILNATPESKASMHELIRSVWIDSENIVQNKAAWQGIWRGLPDPRKTMTDYEVVAYESLPDIVEIYRGVRHMTYWPRGMSWTLDRKRAVFFATRWPSKTLRFAVLTAKVDKKNILAHFKSRGEEEIVVFPRHLRSVSMENANAEAEAEARQDKD